MSLAAAPAMVPQRRRNMPVFAGLLLLLLAAGGARAEHDEEEKEGESAVAEVVCVDDPQGVIDNSMGTHYSCENIDSYLDDPMWTCDGFYPEVGGASCSSYVWQLCPVTCDRCDDFVEDPGRCWDDEWSVKNNVGARRVGALMLIFCCGVIPFLAICGSTCTWMWASNERSRVLQDAAAGRPVKPPDNCCLLCCCGAQVIYIWEGCSANTIITCCLWPCFALCCWAQTPHPLRNGAMVQPVQQAAYGAAVVGRYAQPAPATYGGQPGPQPVAGTVVGGRAAGQPIQATIVRAGSGPGPVGQPVMARERNPCMAYTQDRE